jgi:hypothetical protein
LYCRVASAFSRYASETSRRPAAGERSDTEPDETPRAPLHPRDFEKAKRKSREECLGASFESGFAEKPAWAEADRRRAARWRVGRARWCAPRARRHGRMRGVCAAHAGSPRHPRRARA